MTASSFDSSYLCYVIGIKHQRYCYHTYTNTCSSTKKALATGDWLFMAFSLKITYISKNHLTQPTNPIESFLIYPTCCGDCFSGQIFPAPHSCSMPKVSVWVWFSCIKEGSHYGMATQAFYDVEQTEPQEPLVCASVQHERLPVIFGSWISFT